MPGPLGRGSEGAECKLVQPHPGEEAEAAGRSQEEARE